MSKKRRYGDINLDHSKEDTNDNRKRHAITDSNRYTYLPFRDNHSIRLLTLFPSSDGLLLRCNLEEVGLNSSPDYEAISYVWGDNDMPASIICDSSGKEISITRNLEAVLIRFRQSTQPRRLWVDGICMNQQDLGERSQQVKLMGRIYREASKVLIWLGDEDQDTELAWSCIRLIRQEQELPTSQACEALKKIFSRDWFHRAWTYQESLLATRAELFCGHHQIRREHLASIFLLALEPKYDGVADFKFLRGEQIGILMSLLQIGQPGTLDLGGLPFFPSYLLQLLLLRRGKLSSDPRDLCYSLLGVAADGHNIQPNYSQPVDDVYIAIARYFLNNKRGLCLLGLVECTRPSLLPTWVPDWRVRDDAVKPFTNLDTQTYYATGKAIFRKRTTNDSRKLLLQGVTVDTIVTLENPTVSSLKDSFVETGRVYEYTDQGMGEAFTRTLVADINPSRYSTGADRWTAEDFVKQSSNEDGIPAFWTKMYEQTSNRSFLRTKDRRIGLAPLTAREGDLVCLVLGAEVPFVLRRSNDEYELVGECYVHGLMDEEGLVEAARNTNPEFDYGMLPRLYEWDEDPPLFKVEEFVLK